MPNCVVVTVYLSLQDTEAFSFRGAGYFLFTFILGDDDDDDDDDDDGRRGKIRVGRYITDLDFHQISVQLYLNRGSATNIK